VNSHGDIAFIGDITPGTGSGQVLGVFRFSNGTVTPVACPGDPMPGGGTMVTAGGQDGSYWLNNKGQISFAATVANGTAQESGICTFSDGAKHLVARTGTVIPGVGTFQPVGTGLNPPGGTGGGENNNLGQVVFSATLTSGKVVLLLATPKE
jgi:hypothetical protein